jgi:deazaflavin-dependent oxidoreductase (nitroreductase family)
MARKMGELEMRFLKLLMRPFSAWNARRYLASNGASMGKMQGHDICVVTMTGARSGKRRDVPLMYVPWKEGVLLVASLGGAPKNPDWYYNLVKNPEIDVRVKERTLHLRARLATPAEKATLWPVCVEHYPPYADYLTRTDRDIPVFVCEPRAGGR